MINNKKELKRILKKEKKFYYEAYCKRKRDVLVRVLTRITIHRNV